MKTNLNDTPRTEVTSVIISFMEPIELLKEKINNYFKQYDEDDHWTGFPVHDYFIQMLHDIGDNKALPAERMVSNETSPATKYLLDHNVNTNIATIIELTIFRHVVDILSSTLPEMQFGDDDRYSFSFINATDILIDVPIKIQEE